MFSEQTAPFGTYDIPIDSDFHGDGPCRIWAPGIGRVFSSIQCIACQNQSPLYYKDKSQWKYHVRHNKHQHINYDG